MLLLMMMMFEEIWILNDLSSTRSSKKERKVHPLYVQSVSKKNLTSTYETLSNWSKLPLSCSFVAVFKIIRMQKLLETLKLFYFIFTCCMKNLYQHRDGSLAFEAKHTLENLIWSEIYLTLA